MDDQTYPTNPQDHPQEHQAEPPQSSWPPPIEQPPTYPPNQAQAPYPQYPPAAPPSQPLYPPYGQPGPPSYGPPSYGPPSYGPYGQPQPPSYSGYGQPNPPTNPVYPGYGQPGYAAPSRPLYPPMGQPPQPPQRGLKAWQWVLIAVSGALIFCCAFGAIGSALGGGRSTDLASISATDTPAPTDTPQPTATPVPPGVGDHMALGHDYGTNANGVFYITKPADKFSSGSQFAFVVSLDQGIGTTQSTLALIRVEADGTESTIFTQNDYWSNPTYTEEANKLPTSDLMGGEPAGKYRWQLSTASAVVASATFTYTG